VPFPTGGPARGPTPASVGAFLAARFWFTAQSPARSVEPPIARGECRLCDAPQDEVDRFSGPGKA